MNGRRNIFTPTKLTKTTQYQSDQGEHKKYTLNLYTQKLIETKHKFSNGTYLCAYHCAQLLYTTQYTAVLIIFHLYLQTTTIAQTLCIRGSKRQ